MEIPVMDPAVVTALRLLADPFVVGFMYEGAYSEADAKARYHQAARDAGYGKLSELEVHQGWHQSLMYNK